LPALPFVVLAVAFALQEWGSRLWFQIGWVVLSIWSVIVTWGIAIGGQAFPSDQISNPLLDYALPNWQVGNIARNFGTVLGLKGVFSLIPLVVLLIAVFFVWVYFRSRDKGTQIL
jgi:hypothetical protein